MNLNFSLPISEHSSEAMLQALTAEKNRRSIEDRLRYYKPYPKQLSFHTAGAKSRERLLMAGNQIGKTLAGGFEAAKHARGGYPRWGEGRRFYRPKNAWGCGVSGGGVRAIVRGVFFVGVCRVWAA